MLGMLAAVMFQDVAHLEPRNRQLLISISISWNKEQAAQQINPKRQH